MQRFHIDSFEAVEMPKGQGLNYESFKAAVLRAGRFSVFEATANATAARLYTQLSADVEVEVDKSAGYPWTLVRKRAVPLCSVCRGLRITERHEHINGRHYRVHCDQCIACNGTGVKAMGTQ